MTAHIDVHTVVDIIAALAIYFYGYIHWDMYIEDGQKSDLVIAVLHLILSMTLIVLGFFG